MIFSERSFEEYSLKVLMRLNKSLQIYGLCVGGFKINNNECYNQLVWKISPKVMQNGSNIVQIAAYITSCVFNECSEAL